MECIGWLFLLITLLGAATDILGSKKTRKVLPTLVAFVAGFIVSAVLFPAIFLIVPYVYLPASPLFVYFLGGMVAGGLVEGIRQRKFGRISILPVVWAAIVGGIGAVIAVFLVYFLLGGQ